MGNDIKTTGGHELALPVDFVDQITSGIAQSRAGSSLVDGKPFLRMLKETGEWVHGATDEEVEEGSMWVVNVYSFEHGWVCWLGGKPTHRMVPMRQPRPEQPDPINGKEFEEQVGFECKCITGTDKGLEVLYRQNSHGGRQAVYKLTDDFKSRVVGERVYAFPVLTFSNTWYDHKEFGTIFKPVFEVVGWANVNGELQGAAAPKIEAPAPAPEAPARAKAKPKVVAEAPKPAEPVPTQRAHAPQRRRPGAQPPF